METLLILAAAAVLVVVWFSWRSAREVPCTLEVESSHEHLHALLELEGFDPLPGDGVRMVPVEDDFSEVPLGMQSSYRSRAVVRRASLPKRLWTRLTGGFEFKELFEVGFE